ncbi:MAG TPA: cupin-like domain-containing protein [Blastocatellia bacterium]|nr:cupin-like domain-containing protein [Blastocatellia bacterium]
MEITRLTDVEESLFYRDYYGVAPVLLQSFVHNSRACTMWSPEYLESVIGEKTVQMNHCARELEKTAEGAALATVQYFDVPFRKASELIQSSSDVVYFVMGQSIRRALPELLEDLDFNELILRASPLLSINLWFAAAGHLTPLHYDAYDNFLNQIIGRKKVTLFSPSDKEYLFASSESDTDNPAMVNLFEPDHERFPNFRRATPIEFILEPGDTLYQPAGWFHQIESLDVTVSVNYFFGETS